MTRVAFLTDQHFDHASRWEETLRIADWCAEEIERQRPDVIALGGDLTERRPLPFELDTIAKWLQRLARTAPVIGVLGNHEGPGSLEVLNRLEADHPIRIVERPEVTTIGGIEFALLPWPRKAALLAALGDSSVVEAQAVGVDALLNVLRGLGLSEHDGPRCFVGHVQIRGAKVSTGQPLAPGADFEVGTEDLALARCDAYLLGHIHLGQTYDTASGAPCLYGGSFRRTAYGEVEDKHLVLVDFEGGEARVERVTIPCTKMLLIDAEWSDSGLHFTRELEPDEYRGADCRLRFSYPAENREAAKAGAEHLRKLLLDAGAEVVKLDPQTISTSEARAPEVAKAQTLEAKLRAYWKAKDAVPEPERADRLIGYAHELEREAS